MVTGRGHAAKGCAKTRHVSCGTAATAPLLALSCSRIDNDALPGSHCPRHGTGHGARQLSGHGGQRNFWPGALTRALRWRTLEHESSAHDKSPRPGTLPANSAPLNTPPPRHASYLSTSCGGPPPPTKPHITKGRRLFMATGGERREGGTASAKPRQRANERRAQLLPNSARQRGTVFSCLLRVFGPRCQRNSTRPDTT